MSIKSSSYSPFNYLDFMNTSGTKRTSTTLFAIKLTVGVWIYISPNLFSRIIVSYAEADLKFFTIAEQTHCLLKVDK